MESPFPIRRLWPLLLCVILCCGCDSRDATNPQASKRPSKPAQPAATEADIVGVWKCTKYTNPQNEYFFPDVIEDWLSTTLEFKPDHTTTSRSKSGLTTPGTWSLEGSTITYSLEPVGNNPPIVTPLKWEKGTIVEMSGTVAFIFEKQQTTPSNSPTSRRHE